MANNELTEGERWVASRGLRVERGLRGGKVFQRAKRRCGQQKDGMSKGLPRTRKNIDKDVGDGIILAD